MFKFFNTTGRCIPGKHYIIDPLTRINTKSVMELLQKEMYFVIHAPRQTGKTTYLYALEEKLNKMDEYVALTFSIESVGYKGADVHNAQRSMLEIINNAASERLNKKYLPPAPKEFFENSIVLTSYLKAWANQLYKINKKLILLIDESDSIRNDDLFITFLRQLRDGFMSRPEHFPSSVALIGLRDIRDYKIKLRKEQESLGTASPFNIKARAFFMKAFDKNETYELLSQHEAETGQVFGDNVKEFIFDQTSGQPWLVNAVANQIVSEILHNDTSKKITLDIAEQAKQQLILRRDTHLDSLLDKLKERPVKNIVQSIIRGEILAFDNLNDDASYAADLGIIARDHNRQIRFANRIYAEIIPRVMSYDFQMGIGTEYGDTEWYLKKDGTLDMDSLLRKFQEFYRENSESWLDRYEFQEAGHQLMLMAFLQRVVNAGGDIHREMAVGNGRTDLLVTYENSRFALELKLYRNERTKKQGIDQITRYLDRLGMNAGYLIIFETRKKRTWKQKLYWRKIRHKNTKITLVGL